MFALCICLMLVSAVAWAQTPIDAVADVVANSGLFPTGTTVLSVSIIGESVIVDLSAEAATGLDDTQSDNIMETICTALGQFEELREVSVTIGGAPLSSFLPPVSVQDWIGEGGIGALSTGSGAVGGTLSAQNPLLPPNVAPQTGELSGKLVVLHPSHGTYASATSWFRAMRTLCGPNPVTNRPPGIGNYQPSDYYYWTKGFRWPMYYEDDMSPETIRFLYAYCQAAGAATFCSRNLDKTAGNFNAAGYGYPNAPFTNAKWMTAAKYALQDRGGIPSSVWNTTDVSGESNIDIRARPYYANWLMQTLGYNKNNAISFSLHSNAANTGSPAQAQARGTETYWYVPRKVDGYPADDPYGLKTQEIAYCTAMQAGVISAIRNNYDGRWAEAIYTGMTPPAYPPEWSIPYGTYRGYLQTGPTNTIWQDRGVKTSDFGEVRNCQMPGQLMELLFHDDWKFYPDEAFHQDKIFRATVAWGMYTGICNYFGVTPKPYLGAAVDSVTFPTLVGPNAAISGTISMKNQGMAWTWGNKMIGTVYSAYNIWNLQATADDQFGAAGTEIAIANDGNYYPGDTAEFAVSLTAPATTGLYTTSWSMFKDAQVTGGAFGEVASAQIQVDADAPEITVTAPVEGQLYGPSVAVNFSASDALSDVVSLTADIDGSAVTSGSSVTLGSGNHTLTVVAVDTFGNTATKVVSFQVDADAPVITISAPVGNYGHCGSVVANFGATDAPAGVASISATLDGNPIANGASFDIQWAALGSHTLVVTATDNVGNTGSSTVTFNVIATLESMSCAINQFYAQGQVDNEGIQNSLLVKLANYERQIGDIPDAKNYLVNFINEVNAQSGKHLTAAAANSLLADAAYVIAHL